MGSIFGIFDGEKVNLLNQQPFSDREGKISVVCDGEIYNSEELHFDLEKLGHRFKLETNSELIAHAYRAWAEECPKGFNGAFSFCLYDREKEILFLVRDQVGRMPLYYSTYNGKFAFASEVKSIIEIPRFPREVDLRALNYYMAYRYIPEELSIFKHVKKLPAGCVIRFNLKSGKIEKWRYWGPPKSEPKTAKEDELLEELESVIQDALSMRMKSDPSPGAFLSGGLDSSLIVALMSGVSFNPVKTFSVGYNEEKYNEIPFSRVVSDYFGTEHREFIIEPDFDAFIEAASFFDEPLADPSIVPTYFAVKLAKEHVGAVMSGDGADGLFLGFKTHYLSVKQGEIKSFMISPIKWILGMAGGILPEELDWRIFLENINSEEFFLKRNMVFSANLRKRLFKDWVLEEIKDKFFEPEGYGASIMDSYKGTLSGKMGFFTFKSDPDDILFKMDKISSNFGLRVRTPFLDTRLIEFALGKVPGDMKIRRGVKKYILKRFAKKLLPPELPIERKQGFNPPFSSWLRKEWWASARDILTSGSEDFIQRDYVDKLLKSHKSSVFDHGRKIFCLLVFKIWENRYLNGGS